MVQSISFGPLAIPTAPLFAMLAAMIALDVAARYGRRLQLPADEVWNTGMIALIACLIVARLWNVLHFWDVYLDEPRLILSLRPSGFVWNAGMAGGLVAAYLWMIVKALDPVKTISSFVIGATVGWIVLSFSNYLTGNLLGAISDLPWAMPYFDELRHPVAIYEGLGAALLWLLVTFLGRIDQPVRTFWGTLLGWSVLLLITRAFVEESTAVAGLRTVQVVALLVGLLACWMLARGTRRDVGTEGTCIDQPLSI